MAYPAVSPENGPNSKQFFSTIHFFINNLPYYWKNSNFVFHKFDNDPDALYRQILHPDFSAHPESKDTPGNPTIHGINITIVEGWYYTMFTNIFGPAALNKLYSNVILETVKKHPASFFMLLDNALNEMFFLNKVNITPTGISSQQAPFNHLNYKERINDHYGNISKKLENQLIPIIHRDNNSALISSLYGAGQLSSRILAFVFLVLLPFALLSSARAYVFFLTLTYFNYIIVFSLFGNFGGNRYSDIFLTIPILIIGIGLSYLMPIVKYCSKFTTNNSSNAKG